MHVPISLGEGGSETVEEVKKLKEHFLSTSGGRRGTLIGAISREVFILFNMGKDNE